MLALNPRLLIRVTLLSLFLLSLLLPACKFKETNTPINDPPVLPTPIPWDVAKVKVEELIYKSFKKCSNNPDLIYSVQGPYLHQIRDPRIFDITPSWHRPSDADLENRILWVGTATLSAETFRKYDISNHRALPAEEGTGLPHIFNGGNWIPFNTFTVIYEKGEWQCEICESYKAPTSCKEVQKVLDSIEE